MKIDNIDEVEEFAKEMNHFFTYIGNKHRQQHENPNRHDKRKDHNNGHKDAF